MSLDSMVQDASTGLFVPPQTRRPLLPWADMQALAIPERNAQITPDLISALAVLVAQAKDSPKLLAADSLGRLLTTSSLNPVTTLAQAYHSGDLVVHVVDSSAFFPTQSASLLSATPGGNTCVGLSIRNVPNATTINLNNDCGGQSYVIGDYFVGSPIVTSFNNLFNSDVIDRAARLLGHVTVDATGTSTSTGIYGHTTSGAQQVSASVDNLGQIHLNVRATHDPPTSFGAFRFTGGQTISVTIPPISGLSIDLQHFSFVVSNIAAAAASALIVTVASTGAGGFTLWTSDLATPNVVGSTDSEPKCPFRVVGQPGQGMLLSSPQLVPANYGLDVSVAYTYK